MKPTKLLLVTLLVSLVVMLSFPREARALAFPDEYFLVPLAHTFMDVLETGDILILGRYEINYTTNPDETVTEAYIVRLIEGTTEYGSSSPYAYYNLGYDKGVYSIYMSASDAPTWEGTYTVKLQGNPVLSWVGGVIPDTGITSITWHTSLADMPNVILQWADELEIAWSVNMVDTTAAGNKLASYGVTYFTSSFPNLRVYCPSIFPTVIVQPEFDERDYSQTYAATLADRWATTEYGQAMDDLADYLGLSTMWFTSGLWLILMGIVVIGIVKGAHSPKPALLLSVPMLILGNLWGFLTLIFTILLAFLAVLLLGYVFFYRSVS